MKNYQYFYSLLDLTGETDQDDKSALLNFILSFGKESLLGEFSPGCVRVRISVMAEWLNLGCYREGSDTK